MQKIPYKIGSFGETKCIGSRTVDLVIVIHAIVFKPNELNILHAFSI